MSLIVPSLLTPDPEVSRKRALSQASATERARLARSTSLSRSRSPCCEPRAGASVHRCPGRGRSRGVCDAGRRTSSWPVASAQPSGCRGSPHPSYPWVAIGYGTEVGVTTLRKRWPTCRASERATAVVCASQYTRARMLASGIRPARSEVRAKSADAARFRVLARETSTRPGAPARGESTAQFPAPSPPADGHRRRSPSWTKDTPTSDLQESKNGSAGADRLGIEQAAREERAREHEQILRPQSGSQRDDESGDYAAPLPTLARCRAGGRSRAAVSRRAGHAGGNPRPDPLSGCPVRVVADPRIPAGRPDRTARARSASGFR